MISDRSQSNKRLENAFDGGYLIGKLLLLYSGLEKLSRVPLTKLMIHTESGKSIVVNIINYY